MSIQINLLLTLMNRSKSLIKILVTNFIFMNKNLPRYITEVIFIKFYHLLNSKDLKLIIYFNLFIILIFCLFFSL